MSDCWACGHRLTSGADLKSQADLLADLDRARSNAAVHARVLAAFLAVIVVCVTGLALDIALDGSPGWLWLCGILGGGAIITAIVWYTDGLGGAERVHGERHRLEKTAIRAALHVTDQGEV